MLLVQTVSSGLGFYNMSVYMSFFAEELHASLDAISLSVSLFFISGGVAGLFVARLIERWDIRTIMVIGASEPGVAFGPYLLGLVYVNSDYSVAYLVASVVSLTALVIIYAAGQPVSKVESKL